MVYIKYLKMAKYVFEIETAYWIHKDIYIYKYNVHIRSFHLEPEEPPGPCGSLLTKLTIEFTGYWVYLLWWAVFLNAHLNTAFSSSTLLCLQGGSCGALGTCSTVLCDVADTSKIASVWMSIMLIYISIWPVTRLLPCLKITKHIYTLINILKNMVLKWGSFFLQRQAGQTL